MEGKQRCQVTEGVCETPGGEGAAVYGVGVRCADGTGMVWSDVAADYEAASRLAQRLQQAQSEPCHWQELVEDYITALSL